MSEVTSVVCPECTAGIGEWCYDTVATYPYPPHEYRQVVRGGGLLSHSLRRQATTAETVQ